MNRFGIFRFFAEQVREEEVGEQLKQETLDQAE